MPPMRRCWIPSLLAGAALLILVSPAGAACIRRHEVKIATGTSPSGWNWTVKGSIGNNGSCREWLFGLDFELEGAGYWGSSTGIPAGGHIGRGYGISASDNLLEDGSDRVFSGYVPGEATKVVATLSNNKHLTIHPISVPPPLRRKTVWLRDVRYFVTYYAPEAFVTGVSSFNAAGVLLYRDKTFERF
jgi:hypothetical protein